VTKNLNFGQNLTFGRLLYRPPFTDEGQIWCATADPSSILTCQISSEFVHIVGFQWPKKTILGKFGHFGAPVPTPFYQRGPNMVCCSRHAVYAYVPNFVRICLFCCPKVEHGCTTANLPLSNSIKIVSVLQRLHGKIRHTISDVQKCDEQADRQTDRQTKKLNVFGHPGGG